ncbi:hypothetical protein Tco_0772935, partial [Tanacetum coccineum]
SHGALDLGSTRYMKNEGTVRVLEGTARRYCSKVLLLFESTAHYAQSTARCESTAVMFEGDYEKIEYCLVDVVVEFHRSYVVVIRCLIYAEDFVNKVAQSTYIS